MSQLIYISIYQFLKLSSSLDIHSDEVTGKLRESNRWCYAQLGMVQSGSKPVREHFASAVAEIEVLRIAVHASCANAYEGQFIDRLRCESDEYSAPRKVGTLFLWWAILSIVALFQNLSHASEVQANFASNLAVAQSLRV